MRKVVGETAPKSPTHLAYSLDFIYTHRLQKTRHHPFPEWHSQCGKSHVGHESGFRYNWMKNYGFKLTSTNAAVPWLTRDVRGAAKQKSGHAATLIFIFSSLVTRRVRVCAWVRQCVCLHVCLYCMLERVRARAHPLMRMRMIVGFEAESLTVGPISFPKRSSPPSPPRPSPNPTPPPPEKKKRKRRSSYWCKDFWQLWLSRCSLQWPVYHTSLASHRKSLCFVKNL